MIEIYDMILSMFVLLDVNVEIMLWYFCYYLTENIKEFSMLERRINL